MGCRDFQNKHYSTELNTCSVCSVHAGFKITLAAVLQRLHRRQNSSFQDCADTKVKEKIADAKIANLREQFRKQCTILFSCVESTC